MLPKPGEADSQSRGDEEFNAITDEDSESAKPKQAWQRRSIFNSYGLRRVDKTDEMDEESSHKNGVATPMQTDATIPPSMTRTPRRSRQDPSS